MKIKYPRTPHLSWSPGVTKDDTHLQDFTVFEGKEVVITEKMDGENTTIYRDAIHARSLDSRNHPSRAWVKALQGEIGYRIPKGWRVCGENLYAKHSIDYRTLPSYFLAFSVWDEANFCLSWDKTKAFLLSLGLVTPKVIYQGIGSQKLLQGLTVNTETQEGYVVRLADSFHYDTFAISVAKWVRKQHVKTSAHWMHNEMIVNGLVSHFDDQKEEGHE